MKIGLFGGTFNPVHKNHLKILEFVKNKFNLDKIIIVPTYITPGKVFLVEQVAARDRLKMVKLAVKDFKHKWLKVSDYEIKQATTSYTYLTIEHFKKEYPDAEISFIMGDDRYIFFDQWKKHDWIQENVQLIILRRDKNIHFFKEHKNVHYFSDFYLPMSSSETLQTKEWNNLFPSVVKYIAKNNLYLKTITFNSLKEDRYDHSVSVATHALRLARKYRYLKPNNAYLAGLVHDLFKNEDIKKQIKYLQENTLWEIPPNPAVHGYMASAWLQKEYGMTNIDILSAIKKHTLASGNMSKLDKIIYVADKIANDRDYKGVFALRRLAYKDLDMTFAKILENQVQRLKDKGIEIHWETQEAYNKYCKPKSNTKEKKYGNFKKIK